MGVRVWRGGSVNCHCSLLPYSWIHGIPHGPDYMILWDRSVIDKVSCFATHFAALMVYYYAMTHPLGISDLITKFQSHVLSCSLMVSQIFHSFQYSSTTSTGGMLQSLPNMQVGY